MDIIKKKETTIRVFSETKDKLQKLKLGNEGDAIVIERLIKENGELRQDKDTLYKVILKTSDSPALLNNEFRATFVISRVVFDSGIDDDAKIESLKNYLHEILSVDPTAVNSSIRNIKDMLTSSGEEIPEVLIKFESLIDGGF